MNPARAGRLALLLAIVAVLGFLYWSGLTEQISLDALKARQADLAGLVERRPLTVVATFFLLYVAVAAFSVPGAAILTLAAGAIFDLWLGVAVVSFASTIGATLAFLASRYLLRDWVERRFSRRLETINRGFEAGGNAYLLALRLNPAIPFFLVNLGMGLTRMGWLRFALVSQAGMLPATIVYANAGTQLASIETLRDIASPALIGSLVLLSLFPLLAKAAADAVRRRRAYRGWRRPRSFDRNLVVIGAGAGGLVTAYIGSALKAKVTLIERGEMGGECLNTGCVPSKALIRCARAAHEMRDAGRFGIVPGDGRVDFPAVMRRVRSVIAEIAPADSIERYSSLGVDVRIGEARIVDPWTVEVAGEKITTRSIVIAAGADPVVPEIDGLDRSGFVTTDSLWDALSEREDVPERVVIIGGGPVGVELAQTFARLGSRVAVVEAGARILPREDEEAAAMIARRIESEGVDLIVGAQAVRSDEKELVVRATGEERSVAFDLLLVAVGRRPRLAGYGLERLGIDTGRPLDTNGWLETAFPNIYAVGDVEGSWQLTHAAAHQAWHAAANALFGSFKRFRVDSSVIPRVLFTEPELAQVGHDEASARAGGIPFETVRYDLSRLDRAAAEGAGEGFVKLLVVPGKDRILGATIVAPQAGELAATVAMAMRHRIGLNRLLGTVFAYPTIAEALKMAAGEWRREHQPRRLLRLAELYHRWRRR